MSNWYVIQVNTGKERSIQTQFLRLPLQGELLNVLVPTYSTRFKLDGKWIEKRNILFPGYVFLVTDDIEGVTGRLNQVIGLTKVLKQDGDILPITDSEQATIERLMNAEANADLSTGIIEGTRITITEGPLMGMESQIVKIDRHKRLAWISLQMFGRDKVVQIGLEIVKKV